MISAAFLTAVVLVPIVIAVGLMTDRPRPDLAGNPSERPPTAHTGPGLGLKGSLVADETPRPG